MRRRTRSIRLDSQAWAQLAAVASRTGPIETGGIMLGYRDSGSVVIVGIAEVPDGEASDTTYTLRTQAAQQTLDDIRQHFPDGSPVGYVGDWHSHPHCAPPSPLDRVSLAKLGRSYRKPMAGIIAAADGKGWQPHGYIVTRLRLRNCPIEITRSDEAP